MVLFYYLDKKTNNIIGNEDLIFDNDNNKIILNNKNWYFMLLSDDIDHEDSSTAASLTALLNLKEYISLNYLKTDDEGFVEKINLINASIINRLDKIDAELLSVGNASINEVNSRIDTLEENVDENSSIINELIDNIESIDELMLKTNTSIGNIDSSIGILNSSIGSLKTKVDSIETLLGVENTLDGVINKYEEIEDFLQLISDSSSLVSLLNTIEENIKNNIPVNVSLLVNDCSYITLELLNTINSSINEKIDDISSNLSELTTTVNNISTNILDISTDVNDVSNNLSELTNTVNNISANILDISTGVNDVSTKLNDMYVSNTSTFNEIDNKFNDVDTSINNISKLLEYVDIPAYYVKNDSSNNFYSNTDVEVGHEIKTAYFSSNVGSAKYGYPETIKNWEINGTTILKGTASLGVNLNAAKCNFKLTFDNRYPVLKTLLGNELTSVVISSDESEDLYADITGYYNIGWRVGNNTNEILNFNSYNKQVITNVGDLILNTTSESSYVFIALPVNVQLNTFKVKGPFGDEYYSVTNFTKFVENVLFDNLSNTNKYNIWCCGKSTNNADGTVTPNSQQIKITTQLS